MDCANIAAADPTLYAHLLSCPTEVIPLMDTEARNLAAALTNDEDVDHHIQVQSTLTQPLCNSGVAKGQRINPDAMTAELFAAVPAARSQVRSAGRT